MYLPRYGASSMYVLLYKIVHMQSVLCIQDDIALLTTDVIEQTTRAVLVILQATIQFIHFSSLIGMYFVFK